MSMIKNLLAGKLKPEVRNTQIEASDMVVDKEYRVVGQEGIYAVRSNGVMKYTKLENEYKVKDTVYSDIEEGLELLVPKIPFKYYMMVGDYFRDIYKADGTEAGILFYYKSEKTDMEWLKKKGGDGLIVDGDLIVYCPYQNNTPAIHRIGGEVVYEYLRDNAYPMCWVHSHHTMGISWSGTDDANMQSFEFTSVFKHIYRFEDTLTRIHFRGEYIDIDTTEVFDIPRAISGSMEDNLDVDFGELDAVGMKEVFTEYLSEMQQQISGLEKYPKEWLERSIAKKEEPHFTKEAVEKDKSRYKTKSVYSKGNTRTVGYDYGVPNSHYDDVLEGFFDEDLEGTFEDRYLTHKQTVNKKSVGGMKSRRKTFQPTNKKSKKENNNRFQKRKKLNSFKDLGNYKEDIVGEDNAVDFHQSMYDEEDYMLYNNMNNHGFEEDFITPTPTEEESGLTELNNDFYDNFHNVDINILTETHEDIEVVREVEVEMYDDSHNLVDSQESDINGCVMFEDIEDGTYTISLKEYDYTEDVTINKSDVELTINLSVDILDEGGYYKDVAKLEDETSETYETNETDANALSENYRTNSQPTLKKTKFDGILNNKK